MKTRNPFCPLVAVCLLVLACYCSLDAQDPSTGLPALGSFSGGPLDTVNLANLDVHLAVPVFHKAGKGIPFDYSLSYDSLIWVPVGSVGSQYWTPIQNWGWRAVTEAATGWVDAYDSGTDCYYNIGRVQYLGGSTDTWTSFYYHDTTGGLHPFPTTATARVTIKLDNNPNNHCPATSYSGFTNAVATDNSGYILSVDTSTLAPVSTVNARGGLTIKVPPLSSWTGSGSITDANGNKLQINYNASTKTTTLIDTLNLTALTVTGTPPTAPACTPAVTYSYTAPNNQAATVTVSYVSYWVQTNFLVSGITEYPATNVCLVDRVTLPDQTYYQFHYETTNGLSGKTTGRIASVTSPTGGTTTYSYAGTGCGNNGNCMMTDGSPSSMSRTLSGTNINSGTWSYTRTALSGQQLPQATTTITDPPGNVTTMNFSGIYELNRTVKTGSSVVDFEYLCYNSNFDGHLGACSTASVTAPITRADRYHVPSNGSLTSYVDDQFDTYGNTTSESVSDFGTKSLSDGTENDHYRLQPQPVQRL